MQDDEAKILLRKNLEVARENNRLLKKIRRAALFGNIMRLIWWAIILGVPVIVYYYFLQPYVGQLLEVYTGVEEGVGKFQDLFDRLPFVGGEADAAGEAVQ